MSKTALSMIVSGSEKVETLQRCLNSVMPHVDGAFITITTDGENHKRLKVAAERYGVNVDYEPKKFFRTAKIKELKWLKKFLDHKPRIRVGDSMFQFDEARNHAMKQVSKEFDWLLWLDVDDVLRGADRLKKLVGQAEANKAEAVFLNYLYHVELDENQNIKAVIIEHMRERLIKNTGIYTWVAPIHETLIEQRETNKISGTELGVDVLHLTNEDRRINALFRNVRTLELSIFDTQGKDPRPVYYLGKAYLDLAAHRGKKKYFDRAKKLFKLYLFGSEDQDGNNRSGWAEERSQCWEYLMEIHRHQGNHDKSILAGMNALIEYPKFPSIYLNVALSYLLKGNWDIALFWTKMAAKIPQPSTTLVTHPRDQVGRALEILYNANIQLSKLDEASVAAQKLVEMFPDKPTMVERVKFTEDLKLQRELTKATIQLTNQLKRSGEGAKLKSLVYSLPSKIQGNPFVTNLSKEVNPPREWEKDEIAIFCGPGFTYWSPKSIGKKESFVGGSEEAVIYLTKELVKLGWKVTVYADPGEDAGEINGVNFLPFYQFNNKDKFNILVAWRRPDFVDQIEDAKQTYIWCHDIQNPLQYTKERLKKITKVMVLSPWHRTNIPKVPDNKIMLTGNGIDL